MEPTIARAGNETIVGRDSDRGHYGISGEGCEHRTALQVPQLQRPIVAFQEVALLLGSVTPASAFPLPRGHSAVAWGGSVFLSEHLVSLIPCKSSYSRKSAVRN